MLLHQHYHYYTVSSLQRSLQSSGFEALIQKSGYGGALYAFARVSNKAGLSPVSSAELAILRSFPQKCKQLTKNVQKRLKLVASNNSIGIYCPGRALSILPHNATVRFFDDDRDIQGNYFPPFSCRIESRDELLRNPPKELWIMSRTFGKNLKTQLSSELPHTKILLVNEL
jgi:hypothetical protein